MLLPYQQQLLPCNFMFFFQFSVAFTAFVAKGYGRCHLGNCRADIQVPRRYSFHQLCLVGVRCHSCDGVLHVASKDVCQQQVKLFC